MVFIENKYTKWYYSIISAAKSRITVSEDAENHHIVPESFYINRSRKGPVGWLDGNPESTDNKVFLTYREHIICHMLLVKMTEGMARKKMVHGLWTMSRANTSSKRKRMTARQYEFARKEFCKVIKDRKPLPKREWSEEEKTAHSARLKGIPKTAKAKENMKEAWKHRDRTVKETTSEKLSESITAYWADETSRKQQSERRKEFLKQNPSSIDSMVSNLKKQMQCKHCGLITNAGNHNRWHGDKCRLNIE